jgi:hypothetical protein
MAVPDREQVMPDALTGGYPRRTPRAAVSGCAEGRSARAPGCVFLDTVFPVLDALQS